MVAMTSDACLLATDTLAQLLNAEIAHEVGDIPERATASAIQAIVADDQGILFEFAAGHRNLMRTERDDVSSSTPMDIASLTKPLVGATLAMLAIDEERASWDTPLGDLLGTQLKSAPLRRATLLQLLNHSSGLPAWRQFYLEGFPVDPTESQARQTRTTILEEIFNTPLNAPSGTRHDYSDLGYILLAHVLECLFDAPLNELAEERIFTPLGMEHTRYVGGACSAPIGDAVATEVCPLRGRVVQGTVHDENTHIIGGVSAHAGVFSNVVDLHRFTSHLLDISSGRLQRGLIAADTLRFAWSPEAACPGGSHRGGWDTPSGPQSSAGRGFSRNSSVGHLGFSGTSIWIDRATSLTAILLTNRVHPTRNNPRIKDLRLAFHEAIQPPLSSD